MVYPSESLLDGREECYRTIRVAFSASIVPEPPLPNEPGQRVGVRERTPKGPEPRARSAASAARTSMARTHRLPGSLGSGNHQKRRNLGLMTSKVAVGKIGECRWRVSRITLAMVVRACLAARERNGLGTIGESDDDDSSAGGKPAGAEITQLDLARRYRRPPSGTMAGNLLAKVDTCKRLAKAMRWVRLISANRREIAAIAMRLQPGNPMVKGARERRNSRAAGRRKSSVPICATRPCGWA